MNNGTRIGAWTYREQDGGTIEHDNARHCIFVRAFAGSDVKDHRAFVSLLRDDKDLSQDDITHLGEMLRKLGVVGRQAS